jgi:hypothetical protein
VRGIADAADEMRGGLRLAGQGNSGSPTAA